MTALNKKNESEIIYILKFLAIISVISAHCGNRLNTNNLEYVLNQTLKIFGTIGVPIFFILSGTLYDLNKNVLDQVKNKLLNIVLPWVFTGSIVWFYEYFKNGIEHTGSLIRWLLGSTNYLWYLSILILYYFVFYFVRGNKTIIFILFIGFFFRCLKYMVLPVLEMDFKIPVLFNYFFGQIVFFTIGFYFQNNKIKIMPYILKYKFEGRIVICGIIFATIPVLYTKGTLNYDSFGFTLFVIGLIPLFFFLSNKIASSSIIHYVIFIGKESFAIYLLHMPFAGLISNVFSRFPLTRIFVFLQPILVLTLVLIALFVIKKVLERFGIYKSIILFGLRK